MPPRTVIDNDNRFSFVSLVITLGGLSFTEISGIGYNDTLNRGMVMGTSSYKLGRTRGTYDASANISILKENHAILLAYLGPGWAAKQFDVTVSYVEINQPLITDQLVSCAFTSGKDAWKYGPDPLYMEADLSVIAILRNGIPPYLPFP